MIHMFFHVLLNVASTQTKLRVTKNLSHNYLQKHFSFWKKEHIVNMHVNMNFRTWKYFSPNTMCTHRQCNFWQAMSSLEQQLMSVIFPPKILHNTFHIASNVWISFKQWCFFIFMMHLMRLVWLIKQHFERKMAWHLKFRKSWRNFAEHNKFREISRRYAKFRNLVRNFYIRWCFTKRKVLWVYSQILVNF